ncbi:MAG: hypothetical protein QOD77_1127 [Thermoplasmata archaeon]|jgi:predicted transcriptional regulator|nr:hypothetical protein [Thermoplasmata archaeon]
MRAAACVLLLMLLVPAAAAADGLDLSFGVPAQAVGEHDATGLRWALLVLHGPSAFHLDADAGGAWTNHTVVTSGAGTPVPVAAPPTTVPALALDAGFPADAWGSLYLEADAIELRTAAATATWTRAAVGDALDGLLPAGLPLGAYRPAAHAVPLDGPAAVLAGAGFTLAAAGVRRLEWHGAAVACAQAGACPDGGGSWAIVPGLANAHAYTDLAVPAGTLAGSGTVAALAMGSDRLDLAVRGTLRLPGVAAQGCAAGAATACPADGQTVLAEGNLTLAGLGPGPEPGRLRGRLAGMGAVAFDEQAAAGLGWTPVAVTAVAGGAILGLGVLAKAVVALLLRRREAPEHPRRRRLEALVLAEPGLTFRELQRRTGWANGVTLHHLNRLVRAGRLARRRHGNTVRYFENHGRYDRDWKRIVQARDPDQAWLAGWIAAQPGATQGEVVAHARAERGWSRSATQRRLRGLVAAGTLAEEWHGRTVHYRS